MSNSVRSHKRQPSTLLCPWDSPGKNTGVGCHFLLQFMLLSMPYSSLIEPHVCQHLALSFSSVQSLSHVQLFATPWTVAYEVPPSLEFSRQEYWSGLPFPSPGDLPDPGIEPGSPALQTGAFTIWATFRLFSVLLLARIPTGDFCICPQGIFASWGFCFGLPFEFQQTLNMYMYFSHLEIFPRFSAAYDKNNILLKLFFSLVTVLVYLKYSSSRSARLPVFLCCKLKNSELKMS